MNEVLWPEDDGLDEGPDEPETEELARSGMTLARLLGLMGDLHVDRVLAKTLSANDNSKQQIYVSPGFSGLNILPTGELVQAPKRRGSGVITYAPVNLSWVNDRGEVARAPETKLILYPQYPEVRLSGFLERARFRPSALLTSRQPGRVLLLGIRDADGAVFAFADAAESVMARELERMPPGPEEGVFRLLPPSAGAPVIDWRSNLLEELRELAARGWVKGSRRISSTATVPCNDPNCGGYTLESELKIVANSRPGPDYHGVWELKGHSDDTLTLFDKTPARGYLATSGFRPFMDKYGYDAKDGTPGRRNFGGPFHVGGDVVNRLKVEVIGYDSRTRKVDMKDGRVALVDEHGEEALAYTFFQLVEHWRGKHMKTAYVKYKCRIGTDRQYLYGPDVTMCEGTDPLRVIGGVLAGKVFMDPSPKVVTVAGKTTSKRRWPVRVKVVDLDGLYDSATVETIAPAGMAIRRPRRTTRASRA